MTDFVHQREVLPNGLRFVWLDMPAATSVHVGAYLRGGTAYEDLRTNGVCHLLEHLHLAATETHRTRCDMLNALDAIPGRVSGVAGFEQIGIWFETDSNHMMAAANLLCDVIRTRPFERDIIASEQRLLMTEMGRGWATLEWSLLRELWGDISFGLPLGGTTTSIQNLRVSDISEFDAWVFEPRNTTIVVSGTFNSNDLSRLRATFETIQGKEKNTPGLRTWIEPAFPLVSAVPIKSSSADCMITFVHGYSTSIREREMLRLLGIALRSRSFPLNEAVRYESSSVYKYHVESDDYGGLLALRIQGSSHRSERNAFIQNVLEACVDLTRQESEPEWFGFVKSNCRFATERARSESAWIGHYIGVIETRAHRKPSHTIGESRQILESITFGELVEFSRRLFRRDRLCVHFSGQTRPFDAARIRRIIDRVFGA